ncbi:UDP-Glycosyltransferase/glycogen phosphorylase, partial [Mycena capillaripes]
GHTRPLCALAGRLAAAQGNVVVTMLMAPNWLPQAKSDISAQFSSGNEALERIRVVSLFDSAESQPFALMPAAAEHYPAAYDSLLHGQAIKCASTGMTFAAVPAPAAVILDVFALQQLHATRALSGTAVPIFTFIAANAGSLIRLFCPESMGGQGDFGAKIDAEALRLGKTAEEVGDRIFHQTDGTVFKIPGIPAMYDYETFPQVRRMTLETGEQLTLIRYLSKLLMLMACDGLFIGTAPAYDGETLVAFEIWVKETLHKPVYSVGPLLPPGYGKKQALTSTSPRDVEIKSFLASMGSKFGDKSVLFISFGTVFWPKLEGQIEDFIDVLIEKQLPFILCHASPFAIVPNALSKKIKNSGIGMASAWAPQQFILTHPATGWFLTHCGNGGITESLASGVPMICWPFQADQPIAAVHLSQNLNMAFHLMEVRTAKGLQPLHSGYVPRGRRDAMQAEFREVLDHCRGEVGKEKRRNAQQMQVEMAKAWAAGGSGILAINEFFTEHLS